MMRRQSRDSDKRKVSQSTISWPCGLIILIPVAFVVGYIIWTNMNAPCQLSAWSEWSFCSDEGERNRTRHVSLIPATRSTPCLDPLTEVVDCTPCEYDDTWSDWSSYGSCAVNTSLCNEETTNCTLCATDGIRTRNHTLPVIVPEDPPDGYCVEIIEFADAGCDECDNGTPPLEACDAKGTCCTVCNIDFHCPLLANASTSAPQCDGFDASHSISCRSLGCEDLYCFCEPGFEIGGAPDYCCVPET